MNAIILLTYFDTLSAKLPLDVNPPKTALTKIAKKNFYGIVTNK